MSRLPAEALADALELDSTLSPRRGPGAIWMSVFAACGARPLARPVARRLDAGLVLLLRPLRVADPVQFALRAVFCRCVSFFSLTRSSSAFCSSQDE